MPEEGRNLTADDAWCDNESRFVSTDDSTKKKKKGSAKSVLVHLHHMSLVYTCL